MQHLSKIVSYIIITFVISFFAFNLPQSFAQNENSSVAPADFEQLIDSAKDKGLNVIVISPNAEEKIEETIRPTLTDNALKIREELDRILSKASSAFSIVVKRFHNLSPDGTLNWLWRAILTAIGPRVMQCTCSQAHCIPKVIVKHDCITAEALHMALITPHELQILP